MAKIGVDKIPDWARVRYIQGESTRILAQEIGCSRRTVDAWVLKNKLKKQRKHYHEDGGRRVKPRTLREIKSFVHEVDATIQFIQTRRHAAPKEYIQLIQVLKARIIKHLQNTEVVSPTECLQLSRALGKLMELENAITGFISMPVCPITADDQEQQHGVEIGYEIIRAPDVSVDPKTD